MSTIASIQHKSKQELEEGLPEIRKTPKATGRLDMIVARPAEDERTVLSEGFLSTEYGLVGDSWRDRAPSNKRNPDTQITLMNSRAARLIAGDRDRWPLAGDQLFVDLDLSDDNLTTGDRLSIGDAILEVTSKPHNGCKKFATRFGMDALLFVNSSAGKTHHLRGIYARVVNPGRIQSGETIRKQLDNPR